MKSFSKATKPFAAWNVADLDVESNVLPAEIQSDHVLQIFGTGLRDASHQRDGGSSSNFHSNGTALSLSTWSPDDLDAQAADFANAQWEFLEPSSDFFAIPEQQIWKEKFDAERERVEIIKQARAQAEAILREARAEADQIVAQAQVEIDDAKQAGYQDGIHQLQAALSATHAMITETEQWQADLMKRSEPVLIGMLKELAQTMFGEGVHLDADGLQLNLNRIMEHAQRLGDLNIFLNPRDANLLDQAWSNYQLLITGNKVRIIPSEKIKPGGCVVKGSMGMIDARVDTQLTAVLNRLDEVNEVAQ